MTPQDFIESLLEQLDSLKEEFRDAKDKLYLVDREIQWLESSVKEAENADWEVEE